MRTTVLTALTAITMLLVFADRADAVPVDSAAAMECLKGKAFGDDWNPKVVPHCVCGKADGDKKRVNLSKPGKEDVSRAVSKYGDFTDRCASLSELKFRPKPESKKVVTPPAPRIKFSAMLTPGDTNEVKGGEVIKQNLLVTSGSKYVDKFVASCSACNVNNENPLVVSRPQIPDNGYVFNLTQMDPEKATPANFVVKVIAKNGSELGVFNASVGWAAKAPPPPPPPMISPAKKACEDKPSDGTWVEATGKCVCLGDRVEKNGVCVDKPAPPPAPVVKTVVGRDGSSRVHLRVDTFAGYAKSDTFKTPVFGLALGASFDILNTLSVYAEAGFQLPGATRTDSQNLPVTLTDGSVDKRSNSLMVEAGVEFLAAKYVMLTGGVLYQALGVTAGQTNPVHSTLSGKLGVKVVAFQAPAFRLAIGPSIILGVESRGNSKANLWSGVLLNVTGEFWNIIPYGK